MKSWKYLTKSERVHSCCREGTVKKGQNQTRWVEKRQGRAAEEMSSSKNYRTQNTSAGAGAESAVIYLQTSHCSYNIFSFNTPRICTTQWNNTLGEVLQSNQTTIAGSRSHTNVQNLHTQFCVKRTKTQLGAECLVRRHWIDPYARAHFYELLAEISIAANRILTRFQQFPQWRVTGQ